MSENNNVEVSTENTIDWEARALKAEAKIIADKKASEPSQEETKEVEVKTETTNNYMTREDFEKERFFDANKELVEHKDSINELVSKGYTLEDARTVTLAKDPTIQARQDSSKSNFTNWSAWGGTKSYTQEQLQKLPHSEKMQALRDISLGKATETL